MVVLNFGVSKIQVYFTLKLINFDFLLCGQCHLRMSKNSAGKCIWTLK